MVNEFVYTVEGADVAAVGRKPGGIKADHFSKIWGINIDKAHKTIDVKSQLFKYNHPSHMSG